MTSPLKAACEVVSALQIGLLPGYHVGMGNGGLGCFTPSNGITRVSITKSFCAAFVIPPSGVHLDSRQAFLI